MTPPAPNPATWEVLVVDDDQVVRDSVQLVLAAQGARVAQAPDFASALVHPALTTCDLILCDLMLPDGDGIELVRAMRTARPHVPLVVITGYATTIKNAQALAAGATDFLAKPFDEEELLAVAARSKENRP